MARAYIGTSGWAYKHWKDSWYENKPTKQWLAHNTAHFTGLEANGTFYRLQTRLAFEVWERNVPEDFRFTMKANRFLTHQKRLRDIADGIQRQKSAAEGLGQKLACVVWQLPSGFRLDLGRLESLCQDLREWPTPRHAVEFRHNSWFVPEVEEMLSAHGVANVISDAAAFPRWDAVTTDLVYVRLHGKPYTYVSPYSEAELEEWAGRCRAWLGEGRDVHVYFDNDAEGAAPWDATKLLKMVNADQMRAAA